MLIKNHFLHNDVDIPILTNSIAGDDMINAFFQVNRLSVRTECDNKQFRSFVDKIIKYSRSNLKYVDFSVLRICNVIKRMKINLKITFFI